MMPRFTSLILCLVVLTNCSSVDLLNASITRDGYALQRDIAYGSNPRQMLDIYVPDGAKNAPVVVFFYGGRWQAGSKNDYRFLGQALSAQGFVAVVADYRLYPEVKFPAFVEDGAHAVRYVHDHIADVGGDADQLFIAGHSAGAYIAMMVGSDPRYLRQVGGKRDWVKGIIGIAGPYDFLPFTDAAIMDIFSTAADKATQPIHRITQPMPPVFLATGDADDVVLPRNSYRFAAKLRAQKSTVVEKTYPHLDHIDIMLSLAEHFQHLSPMLHDITVFVRDHLMGDRSVKGVCVVSANCRPTAG